MRFLWVQPLALAGLGALFAAVAWAAVPAFAAGPDDGTRLKVKVGEAAPDIELAATQIGKALPDKKDAKTLRLQDLQGKKNVVLYFYPKALTGG